MAAVDRTTGGAVGRRPYDVEGTYEPDARFSSIMRYRACRLTASACWCFGLSADNAVLLPDGVEKRDWRGESRDVVPLLVVVRDDCVAPASRGAG